MIFLDNKIKQKSNSTKILALHSGFNIIVGSFERERGLPERFNTNET